MARKPTVSIVGAGRVGSAIGVALGRAGYPIAAAWSRSRAGRQRVASLLDAPVLEPANCAAESDFTFVTVSDDAIAEVAELLAPGVRQDSYVIHTSGATSVDALAAARQQGARTGSLHPLQSIPDAATGADALRGAPVAVTTDGSDDAPLTRLAKAWGGKPFALNDTDKSTYHAAAVFAANYVVSSVWAATTLLERIGIKNAEKILGPLVRANVDNVLARGGRRAITGPVSRGDAKTVKRHIATLKEIDPAITNGAIVNGYRAFAEMTEALVRSA